MEPVIVVTDLVRRYSLGKVIITALDGISISIKRGEFISIIGTSESYCQMLWIAP